MSNLHVIEHATSHRLVCDLAAAWCLRQGWGKLAAVEVGVGVGIADVLACTEPQEIPVCDQHEKISRDESEQRRKLWNSLVPSVRDEIRGTRKSLPKELSRQVSTLHRRSVPRVHTRKAKPRVTIIECKRTRSDLLADLRAGKMLKYAEVATHVYLALSEEVIDGRRSGEVLAELESLGLPRFWGVLKVKTNLSPWVATSSVRAARAVRDATAADVWGAALTIGRSLSHRALR